MQFREIAIILFLLAGLSASGALIGTSFGTDTKKNKDEIQKPQQLMAGIGVGVFTVFATLYSYWYIRWSKRVVGGGSFSKNYRFVGGVVLTFVGILTVTLLITTAFGKDEESGKQTIQKPKQFVTGIVVGIAFLLGIFTYWYWYSRLEFRERMERGREAVQAMNREIDVDLVAGKITPDEAATRRREDRFAREETLFDVL